MRALYRRADIKSDKSRWGERPQMEPAEITKLLQGVRTGESGALDQLMSLVVDELRAMAAARMARERQDHTLQPTALVNEAFCKVFGGHEAALANRRHLFGAFAQAMGQVLIDAARKRRTAKRGGEAQRADIDPAQIAVDERALDAVDVNAVLGKLEHVDARAAEVVRLRFFAGLKDADIADILGVEVKTVRRDWQKAKDWLARAATLDT